MDRVERSGAVRVGVDVAELRLTHGSEDESQEHHEYDHEEDPNKTE